MADYVSKHTSPTRKIIVATGGPRQDETLLGHTQSAGFQHRGLAICFPRLPEFSEADRVGRPFAPQVRVHEIR